MRKQIHPNSLENLKCVKRKKEGYGYRYKLPEVKIEDLYQALAEGLSLKAACNRIDIAYDTGKKYFDKGDPARGIKPLRVRLEFLQDKTYMKLDEQILVRRKELVVFVRKIINKLEEQIDNGLLLGKANLNQLEKLIKLEVSLMGGETKVHEKRGFSAEDIRSLGQS